MNTQRSLPRIVRPVLILLVLIASVSIPGRSTLAQPALDNRVNWYQNLPPTQPGFPVSLSGAYLSWGSSPTLADLDNDGTLEVLAAGRNLAGGKPANGGVVYAYRHNGTRMWEAHVRAPINSTPTIADLNADSYADVIVSMGGYAEGTQPWHGGVIALNGRNGQELWTFDTQDWLNHQPDGWRDGVISTPAVGDVNGDGHLEIAFGAWDQCIYLLDRNGQPLWGNLPGILPQTYCGGHGFYNEDTIWSSPALADITGDGVLEIIIGADISPGNVWGDPGGGYLYVLDANGTTLAREWMDQTIFSSPAVADVDGNGDYEIVVGTGTYWSHTGYYVSAFDYDPGADDPTNRLVLRWRKSTEGRVFPSPALADLDGDGLPDVVITAPTGEWGENGTFVYAWRGYDGKQLFKRFVCDMWGSSGNTLSSPVVADIDQDRRPEILFSNQWEVAILNHDGTYYTDYSNPQYPSGPVHSGCVRDHTPTTEVSYWARYSLYASPAVGDLDNDGDVEVVIGGHNPDNPNQGMLFVWTGHPQSQLHPWPTFRRNAQHTGRYADPPGLAVSPVALALLHQSGQTGMEQVHLLLQNTGDLPFTWTSQVPSGVTLTPSSGTVVDELPVLVTVVASGQEAGWRTLGNIVITASANGSCIAGSPTSIPIRLYVGDVFEVYLPLAMRNAGR